MPAEDGPGTVAFDMVGTFFSLEVPRSKLEAIGAPPHTLDLWLAQTLRDSFGWSHAGEYRPLMDVLRASLPRTLRLLEVEAQDDAVDAVLDTFSRLEPAEGAEKACAALAEDGWRILAVTNGAEDSTRELLERAGLADRFHAVLSCDEIRTTKPHRRVYELAVDRGHGAIWLVSVHAWDVAGASRAGLHTAWVEGPEPVYLSVFPPPDVRAADLHDAATRILQHTGERPNDG